MSKKTRLFCSAHEAYLTWSLPLQTGFRRSLLCGLLVAGVIASGCGQTDEKAQDPEGEGETPSSVTMPRGAEAIGQNAESSSPPKVQPPVAAPEAPAAEDSTPDLASLIKSESQLYEYVQSSIASAIEGSPSAIGAEKPAEAAASLSLAAAPLAATQSSLYPLCSSEGDPWDSGQKKLMDPTTKEFSQAAFYCQLNASDTRKTVRGALDQNRRILCDVEKTLGSLIYQAQEKTYGGVVINLSLGCGWTAQELALFGKTQITGTVKTQALAAGEWQKKLVLDFPGSVVMTLFATVSKTSVSFKEIQGWKKVEAKTANQYLAQDAVGSHGHVIQLDYATGTLRAETADTYWGKRVRLVAKGTLDPATGRFKKVDTLNGIYSRFNKAGDEGHTFIDNAVASVVGNGTDGFAYLSGIYHCPQDAACNPNNEELFSLTILNQSKITCVPLTAKCIGNNGLAFSRAANVLNYLMIGAAWDDQVKKRAQFDAWLVSAGIPKFNSVDFSLVLAP